jgi:AbrB family looped-hinge helix DNA binding protein
LSTKGQVILPKSISASRAWGPGTEFTVEETEEGVLLRPARLFPASDLAAVGGCLRARGKRKSVAQMHAAIELELKRRHDSGRY